MSKPFKHAVTDYAQGLIDHHGEGEARAIANEILARLNANTTRGPYEKEMRENADGSWSWLSYKGWVGDFRSQLSCEENIRIHCGD